MERAEFLDRARRYRRLLIAVPTFALLATTTLAVATEEQRYEATATTAIGDLSLGSRDTAQIVANFRAATRTGTVTNAAAKRTGLSGRMVGEGLSTRQVGESAIVRVTFTSEDAKRTGDVARAVTLEALAYVSSSGTRAAAQALAQAQADYDAALTNLGALYASTGVPDLGTYYQVKQNELSDIEVRLAAAGGGDTALRAAADALRLELARVQPALVEYERLAAERDRALATVSDARQRVALAEPLVIGAADDSLTLSRVRELNRNIAIARKAAFGLVAGLVLAALIAALLEALAERPVRAADRLGGHVVEGDAVHAPPGVPLVEAAPARPAGPTGAPMASAPISPGPSIAVGPVSHAAPAPGPLVHRWATARSSTGPS